jgi:hypothetical protein
MGLPVDLLLAGTARTLLEEVLPHLADRRARGQLYACVDVLRNLERRVEPAAAPLEEEAHSAETALAAAASRLAELGEAGLAARFRDDPAAWPAGPAAARAEAARAALSRAFVELRDAPDAAAQAVRPLLGGHLAAQAVRALSRLAPGSLLEEISRGS